MRAHALPFALSFWLAACTSDSVLFPDAASADSSGTGPPSRLLPLGAGTFQYVPDAREKPLIDRLLKRLPPEGQRFAQQALLTIRPGEFSVLRIEGDAQAAALIDSIYSARRLANSSGNAARLR